MTEQANAELSIQELKLLLVYASKAATAAARYIQSFDRSALQVQDKVGGDSLASQVVTQVDIACEQLIKQHLQPSCEQWQIALLGEESADEYGHAQHPRLTKDYFWCIDPLDGTLPFIEGGAGYAVSIALVSKLGQPLLGVVAHPSSNSLYQGVVCGSEHLLYKNGLPWQPKGIGGSQVHNLFPATEQDHSQPILSCFFDRSFVQQANFKILMSRFEQQVQSLGYSAINIADDAGAVMNAIQVLEHPSACYFKLPKTYPGGGSLWDFAATAAITSAADGWVSDIHGAPLDLNRRDSNFMNHRGVLYATDSRIAEMIMALANRL
ncbi:inositol-1-monophosphatase [Corallincola luteus]|uniref:Inositol-1-monophosphatase n=1 Tax=Corallincola luteus TaxID=1775177 RepID=A0ABY2AGN9_9GAMM|nr:inositol monophosphatase family protein [Corallincola luteus]TCI01709.1 inositol-1-monophosphatase [Corallincola luteus]